MGNNLLTRLVLVVIIVCLAVPFVVSAQEGTGGDYQVPSAAQPKEMGAGLKLDGGVPFEPSQSDPANAALPPELAESGVVLQQISMAQAQGAGTAGFIAEEGSPNSLRAPDTCYEYVQNGGFELNANWSGTPQDNWGYITQYYYQGARSMYLSSRNWQNPWLWQLIAWPMLNPLGSLSTWMRYALYLDPGERAYVLLYNESFSELITYAELPATSGGWAQYGVYFPQNLLAGRTVNFAFYIAQDNDGYHSDLYLDNVQLLGCDTPPPTQSSVKRTIDLNISLDYTPTVTQQGYYRNIIRYAADAIYEMTNGVHTLGTVRFYQNKEYRPGAHIIWRHIAARANAAPNGYYNPLNGVINFGDFDSRGNPYITADPTRQKTAGYTVAHELGHYFYGVLDEYKESDQNYCYRNSLTNHMPRCDDLPVQNSVMHSHYEALTNLAWLNFSVARYQTYKNAQYRIHNASAWETLVSPYSTANAQRYFTIARRYYAELAAVAPALNGTPSIQLPGGSTTARQYLDIQFVPPTSLQAVDTTYTASVASLYGDAINFPQPVVLAASLRADRPIARAAVSVLVTAPNAATSSITLKDDGVAPDEYANDGLYSGIMPYNQNGTYSIQVTFTNPTNQAAYTNIGQLDGTWQLAELIGEGFSAVGSTTVTISGYTGDDHSNLTSGATTLPSDNVALHGQINGAGDKDMFKGTLISSGTYVFRLTNLAQNIRPRIRFFSPDGQTLLGDFTIDPEPGFYYIIYVSGDAGAGFIAEVSHANSLAASGLYDVSFGLPLTGEAPTSSILFVPLSMRP